MSVKIKDYRDEEGWVNVSDLTRVIPRNSKAISRILPRFIHIQARRRASRKSPKKGEPRQANQYLISDEDWTRILSLGEELRVIGKKINKSGWHKTTCTCDDGEFPITLWYRIDELGYPLAWEWREDSERGWVTPEVGSMREAMSQLTGDSPLGLRFVPPNVPAKFYGVDAKDY